MEEFPPGAWELPRPNIATWADDLRKAYPSNGVNNARGRLFQLASRVDAVNHVIMHDDDEEGDNEEIPESALMPPPPVPKQKKQAKGKQPAVPNLVENTPSVRPTSHLFCCNEITIRLQCARCVEAGVTCTRRLEQPHGARCTFCAGKKRACSLCKDARSPRKMSVSSEVIEIGDDQEEEDVAEEENEPTVEKEKKSILHSLAKGFKRKHGDRSPEAANPPRSVGRSVCVEVPPPPIPHSFYVQLGSRLPTSLPFSSSSAAQEPVPPSRLKTSPSFSSLTQESGPPYSSSPSLSSFELPESSSARDFEVQRLRIMLNASHEDLRLQRQHYEDRERREQERFEAEREIYNRRIRELEESRKGEGSSSFQRW